MLALPKTKSETGKLGEAHLEVLPAALHKTTEPFSI
jgi:hypothetical protein